MLKVKIFNFLKFEKKNFIDENEYENIREEQIQISQQKIEEYLKFNIDVNKTFKVEYFFITNTKNKAEKFYIEIKKLNYTAQYFFSPVEKIFLIAGLSPIMNVSDDVIIDWTKEMCEFGYNYDSKFDGWEITNNYE